jgi:hypothetical protein
MKMLRCERLLTLVFLLACYLVHSQGDPEATTRSFSAWVMSCLRNGQLSGFIQLGDISMHDNAAVHYYLGTAKVVHEVLFTVYSRNN